EPGAWIRVVDGLELHAVDEALTEHAVLEVEDVAHEQQAGLLVELGEDDGVRHLLLEAGDRCVMADVPAVERGVTGDLDEGLGGVRVLAAPAPEADGPVEITAV